MQTRVLSCAGAVLVLLPALIPDTARSQKPVSPRRAVVEDRVVAGGPKDFLEVRRVVLKGSNEAIGHALAVLAKERFRVRPLPNPEPFRGRAQRRYIEKNYPILFERMRGVASAFGGKLDNDALNFSALYYPTTPFAPGCSVVHLPPTVTASGTSIVSRNYDFTTGSFRGTRPKAGELPCTGRPYILELHPEGCYSSIALVSYDLLSGVVDGMNSEGLTVALLADDELNSKFKMEPAGLDTVGLGVLQMQRLLLDTCATVEEAKEALLLTKQYYEVIPVHYLIADRHGKSFIWEYSQAHNREYIIENPGKPLVSTNFSLHRHLEGKSPPSAATAKKVCPRYSKLCEKLAGGSDKLTPELIKETHRLVDATLTPPRASPRAAGRTLWHALYVPEEGKVQVSFYLRDERDDHDSGKPRIVRSDYLEYTLKRGKSGK
jgi:hypothetical protein